MILDSKVPCVALAIAFATSSLLGAQDQNSKVRNEYAALVKAAEERLKNSISKAQSRYLADINRAQQHLDARLNHPKNKFEEYVTVLGAEPGAIQRGHDNQGWYEIPKEMKRAVIFTPKKDQSKDGVVEFTVNANTRIGLAASWAYDGNAGGGWHAERKSKEDLRKLGWIETGEMFLNLFDRHTLFVRECEKGERIRIRTRKYNRPFVFIPNALEQAPVEGAKSTRHSDLSIDVVASTQNDTEEFLGLENTPEILRGTKSFTSPLSGVALIKSHKMTKVFVAASWGHDGNSSGQWTEEVWTEEAFKEKGWEEVGTVNIKHRGSTQEHKLFVKVFNEGEQERIRTRKYGAPYVFASKP